MKYSIQIGHKIKIDRARFNIPPNTLQVISGDGKIKKILKNIYTHTTIHQWPGAYLLHRCCYNYYTEKFLFNMILL